MQSPRLPASPRGAPPSAALLPASAGSSVSPRGVPQLRKQGYLTKTNDKLKQQQRYYVLEKGTLSWYNKPLGKRIGTMDLGASVIKGLGLRYFQITTTIGEEHRRFILSGRDLAETSEWLQAVRAAQAAVTSGPAATASAGAASTAATGAERFGWLSKKGKNRWFLLRENVLYWFTREQPPSADIRKEMRGCLPLDGCTVTGGAASLFTINAPNEVYSLVCKSNTECAEWVRAIEAALRVMQEELQMASKRSGWLEKKRKRRWFVLDQGVLKWFVKEGDGKERGQLDMGEFEVAPPTEASSRAFTLCKGNLQYELVAASPTREWMETLRTASARLQAAQAARKLSAGTVEKRSWFLKKRKRRYCVLRNHVLMWFTSEADAASQGTMKGSLDLRECAVTAHGFELAIRSKEGGSYVFTSTSKEEVADWAQGIKDAVALAAAAPQSQSATVKQRNSERVAASAKRGWAVKKGKRRYLVLRPGELFYFDREQPAGDTFTDKPKGVIRLATASANEINAESFLVRSEGMTYGWMFECPAHEMQPWVDAISAFIVLARESLETGLSMSGWMIKKGSRRWFALRRGTLYWFKDVHPVEQVDEEHANGKLSLLRCTVALMEGQRNTLAITPPVDSGNTRVYDLGCYTANECTEWVKALKASTTDAMMGEGGGALVDPFASSGKGLVFGRPLEEVLRREGTELPRLVTTCIEFLRANALEWPGLFRLSGSTSKVNALKDAFDRGEEVVLSAEESDVDSVANVLKLYLRQLPEPPLTFELYEEFLDAAAKPNAPQLLAGLVDRLPTPNYDLLKYLLKFLAQVISHSETNQMNANNIAIVVGPNLLRAKELDMASGLRDTPLILSCARMLVKEQHTIFDEE